jgi:hypothetical protein
MSSSPRRRFPALSLAPLSFVSLVALAACGNKEAHEKTGGGYQHVGTPAGSGSAYTAEAMVGPRKGDHVSSARILVEDLGKGDFAGALAIGDDAVRKEYDAKKLEAAWTAAVAGIGKYKQIEAAYVERLGRTRERVRVRAVLEGGDVDVQVSFDDGKDAATAVSIARAWSWPAGVDRYAISLKDAYVGEQARGLSGTITRPKHTVLVAGKVQLRPAVVLVHDQGPNDRDESFAGGARPFRDLALGLASKGVIVLTFDKRTYAGNAEAGGLTDENATLKGEYVDDVVAAAAFVRGVEGVDASRVFVIGHGEGGWLVPMFFAADPQLAGGVLLGAHARTLDDVLVPEAEQLAAVPGSALGKDAIADLEKRVEKAKDKALSPKTPASELPLGLGAAYWQDVRRYDAIAVATRVRKPMLVLQGGRDFRVTEKDDFGAWKKAFEGRSDVRLELYPKLNHAFFAGEGPIDPVECATKAGHVDQKVIDDVATFVIGSAETAIIGPAIDIKPVPVAPQH